MPAATIDAVADIFIIDAMTNGGGADVSARGTLLYGILRNRNGIDINRSRHGDFAVRCQAGQATDDATSARRTTSRCRRLRLKMVIVGDIDEPWPGDAGGVTSAIYGG